MGFDGPRRTAIHLVSSLVSRAIFKTMVRGTDNSIPIGPNTHPQKINERNTTSVERPTPRPMTRGSIILPNIVLTAKYTAITRTTSQNPSSIIAMSNAGMRAMIEPIVGI